MAELNNGDNMGMGADHDDGMPDLFRGMCPDKRCGEQLYFTAEEQQVGCTRCGQLHAASALHGIEQIKNELAKLHHLLRKELLTASLPPKSADLVKAHGMSNYHCKLLSPLLTHYGMEQDSGLAVPMATLRGNHKTFDCGSLSGRAFQIEPEYLNVPGYGRDQMGSTLYLKDTLDLIDQFNDRSGCLVPIHADGDGHCLVHALSRALIGRELFWHALRHSLKSHLAANVVSYQQLLHNFVEASEWQEIIMECDPSYQPADDMQLGLRPLHVFGLANVLRRPIVLLDCLSGIQSSGDYSCIFLPIMCPPEMCRNKTGSLNKPLCIAWSSSARNHYIALVGVKGMPLPRLPNWMFEHAWAVGSTEIARYVDMDGVGSCEVGGGICLPNKYIERLVTAMDQKFTLLYSVAPSLVCDVAEYIFKPAGISTSPDFVREQTRALVADRRLGRCLMCEALTELPGDCILEHARDEPCWLCIANCKFCRKANLRTVRSDGTVEYKNGDKTSTRATKICKTGCSCGFKHYWNGKEYDNVPIEFPLEIDWDGHEVKGLVTWFYGESDSSLNSNAYNVACSLVDEHFPGRFGIERLYQQVAQRILKLTEYLHEPADTLGNDGAVVSSSSSHASTCSQLGPMDTLPYEPVLKASADVSADLAAAGSSSHAEQTRPTVTAKEDRHPPIAAPAALPSTQSRRHQKSITDAAVQTSAAEALPMDNVTLPQSAIMTSASKGSVLVEVRSTGEKCHLKLDTDEVYATLLEKISCSLHIDKSYIRSIRYGFPPRDLSAPETGIVTQVTTQTLLPVKSGDKLTVELHAAPSKGTGSLGDMRLTKHVESPAIAKLTNEEGAAAGEEDRNFEVQLKGLEVDLYCASRPRGISLWSYAETRPQMFLRGGRIYEMLQPMFTLHDGLHVSLSLLGDRKILCYNEWSDRFELCLEAEGGGHIPIGMSAPSAGDAGNALANSTHRASSASPAAFSGRGHSLRQSAEGIDEVMVTRRRSLLTSADHKPTAMVDSDYPRSASIVGPASKDSSRRMRDHIFEASTFAAEGRESAPKHRVTAGGSSSPSINVQPSLGAAAGSSAAVRLGPGYTVLRSTKPDPAAAGAFPPSSEDAKQGDYKSAEEQM